MSKKVILPALILGGITLVSGVAVNAAQLSGSTISRPSISGPALVTEVPDTIPTGGVNVNNQATLLPPQATATISMDKATLIAKTYDNAPGLSVTGVRLTDFTDPGSVPLKGSNVPFHTIQHVLAWVVTLTSPNPVDVSQAPNAQIYVTHDNLVINAKDGSFVEGFFTK